MVGAFTAQHKLQSPDLAPELQVVVEQYKLAVAEVRTLADEVRAEGFDIVGAEGMAMLVAAFPGVGLWLRERNKPSRSAGEVEKLKSESSELSKEFADLRIALATKAGANETIPG